MKFITYFCFTAILIGGFCVSCNKTDIASHHLASLVVINSVISGGNVKLNSDVNDSAKSYNSKLFGLTAGNSKILLYPTNNPVVPYFNTVRQIDQGSVNFIFLAGQSTAIDTIFMTQNISPYSLDSSVAVRVINLSVNSTPLNITLASTSASTLFSGVSYKQLTGFMKISLPATIPAGSVSFQLRDAANNLLSTYTLPPTASSIYPNISVLNSRNRSITLVIKGLMGTTTGNDAISIFPVANY